MNENENSTAVAEWPVTSTPQPKETHRSGVETDELPTVKAGEEAAKTLALTVTAEGVTWDGTEAGMPKDAKVLASLRRYFFSLAGSHSFKTKAELAEFSRRRALFGKIIHASEQGLPTIQMVPLTYERVRHTGRADSRADSIAKLTALKAGDSLDTAPLKVLPTTNSLICRTLAPGEQNILPAFLHDYRRRIVDYALAFFQSWDKINYHDRADEIRLELTNTGSLTAERLAELQAELALLESSSAELIADAACGKLSEAFTPVAEIIDSIHTELIDALESKKAGAIAAEESFFGAYDLKREATTVSRQYETLIKSLNDQHARAKAQPAHVTRHRPVNPNITGIPIALEIIPGVL
jgi:hypothetical protein